MDNPISGNPDFVAAYKKASAANRIRETNLDKTFVARALQADFIAPSRLGDKVAFTLVVRKLGGSSVMVEITGRTGAELRLRAQLTLVWIDNMKAARWPEPLRARLAAHLETAA